MPPPTSGRNALLDSIRQDNFKKLKKVKKVEKEELAEPGDLLSALKMRMNF